MQERIDILRLVEWCLFAAAGGVVRFLSDRMNSTAPFSKARDLCMLIGNALISGFSGLLGALLVSTVTSDASHHLVVAGVFGYFGTKGIERVADYVQRRFKV